MTVINVGDESKPDSDSLVGPDSPQNSAGVPETQEDDEVKTKGSGSIFSFFKKKKKGDEESEQPTKNDLPPVSFLQLFRYATLFEKTLVGVGVTVACISGLYMPAMIILFGRLTNAFVYSNLNQSHAELIGQGRNITDVDYSWGNGSSVLYQGLMDFGLGTIIIAPLQFVNAYIFVTSLNYAAERQVYRLRGLFLKSILKQEIGWFDTRGTNDFASRVTEDLNKVQEGIGEKLTMFVFFESTFVYCVVIAFIHGWQLTLVILAAFPFLGLSTGLIAKIQSSLATIELKAYSKAGIVAEEVLSSVRTVVSFGGEKKEVERYEKKLIHARAAGIRRGVMTGVGTGVTWFIIYASYALAFWYGTKLVLDSRAHPSSTSHYDANDLLVVFFCVLMGAMYVGQASPYLEAFNVARGAAASIFDIIERDSAIDPTSTAGFKPKTVEGTIELKNVHFSYPARPDVNVLQGLDLQINPGESVALVGSSGCGKSTCIQLIQRFYDPLEGAIYLDGANIQDLNLGWLRNQIGVVGQEPVLFATTIAENIRYGYEAATIEEIQEAAKEANAHDFIMKLPEKYNTQVGERGVQMSGGQKQRIAIARALIKRPKILLLDEATSALDNESEAVVQRALDKVRKGRTTIIVAHRLSTIKSADCIVAMKDGKVIEVGTHKDLMTRKEYYRSLVLAQLTDGEDTKDLDLESEETLDDFDTIDLDSEETEGLNGVVDEIFQVTLPLSRSSSMRQSYKRRRTISGSARTGPVKRTSSRRESILVEKPIKEILKLNYPEWGFIIGGIIGAAIQGCLIPIYAICFGNVLGTLALSDIEKGRDEANYYSLLFFILGLAAAFSMFLQAYMFSISGERLTLRLRKQAFSTMLQQDMGWFDDKKNSVGALCARLSADASAVQGATGSRIGTLVQVLATLIFSGILGIIYNFKLGAVALPFIPFVLCAVFFESKVIMGQSITESKVLEDAGKIAIEAISNIRTVASLHKEEKFASLYSKALYKPHLTAKKKSHIRGAAFGFSQATPFTAYAVVLFYGGYLVENGEASFQDVFKVAEAMIFGTMMVGQAIAFAPNYSKGKVAAARLIALFNKKPAIDASANVGQKMKERVNEITLKNVEFRYPTRPSLTVLKDLSLDIKKGEKVALVGSSGCGKSTVINLLERFYDPRRGSVFLNKRNIQTLNVGYTRSIFGLVSQEPVLFDRTISENIAYGNNSRTFSQRDIEEVAKQANIHEFIASLPNGYNTRVGPKGTQLSGGQKQRIAIARALIRNPQVLLLDEATSALDAESEKIVQETLDEVQRDRTSIIIAHRLSTIRDVDKIVVVDAGQVVEEGTHDDLIAKQGHYWQLYNVHA